MRLFRHAVELKGRVRPAISLNRSVLVNAGSMVSTAVVTSLLGFAFWLVAAKEFSQSAVGVAGAAVSAMMLLGFLATLGLGTLLMGELPRMQARRRALISAALLVTGAAGMVLGLGFAVLMPLVSSDLDALSESWVSVTVFAAGVGLTALAFVLDQALIGLLRGGLQLTRNVVFSVVKLAALVALALAVPRGGTAWIYAAWVAGIGGSLLVLMRFYARRDGDPRRAAFAPLREMRRPAATHHAFNLALRTPELVMPIVVVALLSATTNASFYVAWMIAGFLFAVPLSLSTVLYAVGSGDRSRLEERLRMTLLVSLGFGLVANLVLLAAGGPLMRAFGSDYAGATTALQILALGVFPETIRTHYVAVRRIDRRIAAALPVVWGGTALELVGGAGGALLGGLNGVAVGWLIAVCVEALVMGGDVLKAAKAPYEEEGDAERWWPARVLNPARPETPGPVGAE